MNIEDELDYLQEVIDFAILPNTHFMIEEKEIRAIRNIIKGYRQMEEQYDKLTRHFINNHVPKSKIKDKIEPVIESLEKNGFVGYADELRDIMSELMEDK